MRAVEGFAEHLTTLPGMNLGERCRATLEFPGDLLEERCAVCSRATVPLGQCPAGSIDSRRKITFITLGYGPEWCERGGIDDHAPGDRLCRCPGTVDQDLCGLNQALACSDACKPKVWTASLPDHGRTTAPANRASQRTCLPRRHGY